MIVPIPVYDADQKLVGLWTGPTYQGPIFVVPIEISPSRMYDIPFTWRIAENPNYHQNELFVLEITYEGYKVLTRYAANWFMVWPRGRQDQ